MTTYMYQCERKNSEYMDFGEAFFHVFAKNDREAWKKVDALEGSENVKRIFIVKAIEK